MIETLIESITFILLMSAISVSEVTENRYELTWRSYREGFFFFFVPVEISFSVLIFLDEPHHRGLRVHKWRLSKISEQTKMVRILDRHCPRANNLSPRFWFWGGNYIVTDLLHVSFFFS